MTRKPWLFGLAVLSAGLALGTVEVLQAESPREPASRRRAEFPAVTIAGVRWEGSWPRALERARKEKKPILHFQLLGRLDDAFC